MGKDLEVPKWAVWRTYLSLVDYVIKEAEQLLVSLHREARNTRVDCHNTGEEQRGVKELFKDTQSTSLHLLQTSGLSELTQALKREAASTLTAVIQRKDEKKKSLISGA